MTRRQTPSLATYAGRWPFRPHAGFARPCPYTALIGVACGPTQRGYAGSTTGPFVGETQLAPGKHRFGFESRALVGLRESSLASPFLTGIGSSLWKGERAKIASVAFSPFQEFERGTARQAFYSPDGFRI